MSSFSTLNIADRIDVCKGFFVIFKKAQASEGSPFNRPTDAPLSATGIYAPSIDALTELRHPDFHQAVLKRLPFLRIAEFTLPAVLSMAAFYLQKFWPYAKTLESSQASGKFCNKDLLIPVQMLFAQAPHRGNGEEFSPRLNHRRTRAQGGSWVQRLWLPLQRAFSSAPSLTL